MPYARDWGRCAECGRITALNVDGSVRKHQPPTARESYSSMQCRGSGKPPTRAVAS